MIRCEITSSTGHPAQTLVGDLSLRLAYLRGAVEQVDQVPLGLRIQVAHRDVPDQLTAWSRSAGVRYNAVSGVRSMSADPLGQQRHHVGPKTGIVTRIQRLLPHLLQRSRSRRRGHHRSASALSRRLCTRVTPMPREGAHLIRTNP
jgi:hypothetical protein